MRGDFVGRENDSPETWRDMGWSRLRNRQGMQKQISQSFRSISSMAGRNDPPWTEYYSRWSVEWRSLPLPTPLMPRRPVVWDGNSIVIPSSVHIKIPPRNHDGSRGCTHIWDHTMGVGLILGWLDCKHNKPQKDSCGTGKRRWPAPAVGIEGIHPEFKSVRRWCCLDLWMASLSYAYDKQYPLARFPRERSIDIIHDGLSENRISGYHLHWNCHWGILKILQ